MVFVCFRGFKIKSADGPIIIIIGIPNPVFLNVGCGRRLDPSRHPFLHSHVPQKGNPPSKMSNAHHIPLPLSSIWSEPGPPAPGEGESCHPSPAPRTPISPSPHPTPRVPGLPQGRGSADCGQCVGRNVIGTSTRPHPTHPPDRIIYPPVGGGAVR